MADFTAWENGKNCAPDQNKVCREVVHPVDSTPVKFLENLDDSWPSKPKSHFGPKYVLHFLFLFEVRDNWKIVSHSMSNKGKQATNNYLHK